MDDAQPIVKSTSPWLAAIICSVLVLVAGASGALIMRTQILAQVSADMARTRSTVTGLQNRIATLESQTAALAQTAQPDLTPLNALKTDLETANKQVADLAARIEALEKKPAPVVAVAPPPAPAPINTPSSTSYTTLAETVRSGAPFADALAAWKKDHAFVPDALAPLTRLADAGVPTETSLRSQLQAALASIPTTPAGEVHGLVDRVNTQLSGLVSIKKQSAMDPYDALRTDAGTMEIASLQHKIMQLSPAARTPLAAWLDAAQSRDEALAALVSLAAIPPKTIVAP